MMAVDEVETLEETSESTQVAEAPVSIIGDDGMFTEKWRDVLDEDIRNEKCLNTVKDIKSMAKQFVHSQRMIGKDKIAIPNEKSTPEVWNEYFKAVGKPETSADYNLVKPEDMPDEYFDKKLADSAQEFFHKINLTKEQAQAIFEFHNKNIMLGITNRKNDEELALKTATEQLGSEWGNAYDQRIHYGNVAVEYGTKGDGEFTERLTNKYGTDPDFVRFASNLGEKFAEHGDISATNIPTPSDLQEQAMEIVHSAAYVGGVGVTREQHKAAVAKAARLFEQIAKSKKTTVSG